MLQFTRKKKIGEFFYSHNFTRYKRSLWSRLGDSSADAIIYHIYYGEINKQRICFCEYTEWIGSDSLTDYRSPIQSIINNRVCNLQNFDFSDPKIRKCIFNGDDESFNYKRDDCKRFFPKTLQLISIYVMNYIYIEDAKFIGYDIIRNLIKEMFPGMTGRKLLHSNLFYKRDQDISQYAHVKDRENVLLILRALKQLRKEQVSVIGG